MGGHLHINVYRQLRDAARRLKDELRLKIEEKGITWPQFHALFHINEQGVSVNELAGELHCNASNITGLVDRMTENGWVYREHSSEDRRVWLIRLTDEGIKMKENLIPQHNLNIIERMSVLNEGEMMQLLQLIDKLMYEKTKEDVL